MSKKTPQASIDRALALLAGAKPSQKEAALSQQISLTTLERALKDPANRDRAKPQGEDGAGRATRDIVRSMLTATLPDGGPDATTRQRGATLRLRYSKAFEDIEADEPDVDDDLPRGCKRVQLIAYPTANAIDGQDWCSPGHFERLVTFLRGLPPDTPGLSKVKPDIEGLRYPGDGR